jgi:bifunctional UDP-N-acetylglucosamine pyrophosphorylase/glucosamine-1-phosphate N-acetyltransferase
MSIEVIILAAGQGTRMKSRLPKVLHVLAGRPLLEHVITTAQSLQPDAVHVVIGYGADEVRQRLHHCAVNWVIQSEQLGTGHGVLQAIPAVSPESTVLVLYGDVPMIDPRTLATLVASAASGPALLTARVADPSGYGRIMRDASGDVVGVVEHKDATPQQREINEINTGLLAAPARDLIEYLPQVRGREPSLMKRRTLLYEAVSTSIENVERGRFATERNPSSSTASYCSVWKSPT